ncbi:MAG: GumC family protein [Chthoniobacterales bacterium]
MTNKTYALPSTVDVEQEQPHSGLSLDDILFAIFKHKGKILFGIVVALAAAAAVYLNYPPVYQSEAKLLVRYVLDRSPVDPVDGQSAQSSVSSGFGRTGENVIGSEAEILTSWDLAMQVATAIGPKRLLPELGDNATAAAAAGTVSAGLEVVTRPKSDIILVSYKNPDPQLAVLVLEDLVNRYFSKHLEVHRSSASFDFVTQQADQVRARLQATEDALKSLKAKVGVTSPDNTQTLSADIVKLEEQYSNAQAELGEQQARVKQIEGSLGGETASSARQSNKGKSQAGTSATPGPSPPSGEDVLQYQAYLSRINDLRKARLDLLARYTPASETVRLNQGEITTLENQKREMEKRFPDLVGQAPAANGDRNGGGVDLGGERARLAGLQARVEILKNRLDERTRQLSEIGSQIADLERKRDLEETNYKYFQAAVEKARVDEALDPSKMPNISPVQRPSPPRLVAGKRDKIALGLAGGGIGLSLALAVLGELFLNRTVKRPIELEKRLGAPLLLSIPYSRPMKRLKARRKKARGSTELITPTNGNGGNGGGVASWEVDHFIRPYAEAIRDRLNLYFEINRMTHKPKLVGITGFGQGAGASTMAAGLAATLSEMGDGKVLLVDVNLGVGAVHPFFEGKPAYPLTTALQPATTIDSASENLYLATVAPPGAGPMQIALKRFFDLMPNLKASDFDYIIFDMPPLSETTPTLGMARFMDKVLLVVEAEKTGREQAKRGYQQLSAARANVSVVLNKTRSYLPKSLDGES